MEVTETATATTETVEAPAPAAPPKPIPPSERPRTGVERELELLTPAEVDPGKALYRLRVINNQLMTKSLESTSALADVYTFQLSLRYSFR